MSFISLEASIPLTGLSRRTLWRRIADGTLRKLENDGQEEEGREEFSSREGSPRALLSLSRVLELAGLRLDEKTSERLLAADRGNAEEQLFMGQYFYAQERYALAVYWFQLAAARGSADAMHCLGKCYAFGHGAEKNEELAWMWVAKAAAHEHVIAQRQMRELLEQQALTPEK
ncbi:MAG: hypothetical protein LBG69_08515 [Zoogloeaceae bacterium]|jgi:hypothetical protein|nr:hypothetical protein [Zoogloeaceae bacterium]